MELVTYPALETITPQGTQIAFPDLPAASVVDPDPARARLRAKLGLAIIISDLQSHFEPVPAPRTRDQIEVPSGARLVEITTDLARY